MDEVTYEVCLSHWEGFVILYSPSIFSDVYLLLF